VRTTPSFMDAARQVIEAEGRPLTTKELYDAIMARGLVTVQGKTPYKTLVAQLYKQANAPNPKLIRIADMVRVRAKQGGVRWGIGPTTQEFGPTTQE
jgi:hypothetical protein